MTTYEARTIHQVVEAAYQACRNDPRESPARQHELGRASVAACAQYRRLRSAEERAYAEKNPDVLRTGTMARELPADVDRGFSLPN